MLAARSSIVIASEPHVTEFKKKCEQEEESRLRSSDTFINFFDQVKKRVR